MNIHLQSKIEDKPSPWTVRHLTQRIQAQEFRTFNICHNIDKPQVDLTHSPEPSRSSGGHLRASAWAVRAFFVNGVKGPAGGRWPKQGGYWVQCFGQVGFAPAGGFCGIIGAFLQKTILTEGDFMEEHWYAQEG